MDIEIEAGFEHSDSADVIACQTVDITEDGARVRPVAALRVGIHGLIVLDTPDGSVIMAGAEVQPQSAHDEATGTYRLAFVDMTATNRARLRVLVDDPLAITFDPDVARVIRATSAA